MKALKKYSFFTIRTFFVLSVYVVVACAQKSETPKEIKENNEAIPRVIFLNPPASVPRGVIPLDKAQNTENTEIEQVPPRAIPLQPQAGLPKPVVTLPAVNPVPVAPVNSLPSKTPPVVTNPAERKDFGLSPDAVLKKRPPQFMMFAFDNCTENERWQDLAAFSHRMRELDRHLEFTFFLSGVNFIPDNKRMFYKGPHHAQGASNIGFGGSLEDIKTRSAYAYKLHSEGHELASHAVGHFSGTQWSEDDWIEELQKFKKIFTDNFHFFGYSDASKIASSIVGFRAPYLDRSPGLYPALKSLGYRYDTSDSADYRLWPKKNTYGLWQFPLFELTIVGNGSKSISMDYNFFVHQSKDKKNPKNDPENEDKFADEMMQTYLKYFKANYFGNRAPLSIGHHFFPYQRGVYNRVLKQFAMKVCALPEVRCVKYTTLANYLDSLSQGSKDDYQAARFEKLAEYPLP
jgi:hypothetical protein